jgi:2-dehydropantoate 2-reductase
MRIIVFGAGAIGGVIGARLFQQNHDVTLVARGSNFLALSKNGLRLETSLEATALQIPVVEHLNRELVDSADFVILTVKSQDTNGALEQLNGLAPKTMPIVCAQNGVENERVFLRNFQNVYGMCVMCPATHLTPGVVQANSSPITGLLDLGVWPFGVDERAHELATALRDATFDSVARDDISRWKWGKLLINLGNAVEAVCGRQSAGGTLARRALQEGIDVLQAANISYVGNQEGQRRRGHLLNFSPVGAAGRGGGSTWQSLTRGIGPIETDFLSGEIVLQGRLHGVATPVNELLRELANQIASKRKGPGALSEERVLSMLDEN